MCLKAGVRASRQKRGPPSPSPPAPRAEQRADPERATGRLRASSQGVGSSAELRPPLRPSLQLSPSLGPRTVPTADTPGTRRAPPPQRALSSACPVGPECGLDSPHPVGLGHRESPAWPSGFLTWVMVWHLHKSLLGELVRGAHSTQCRTDSRAQRPRVGQGCSWGTRACVLTVEMGRRAWLRVWGWPPLPPRPSGLQGGLCAGGSPSPWTSRCPAQSHTGGRSWPR